MTMLMSFPTRYPPAFGTWQCLCHFLHTIHQDLKHDNHDQIQRFRYNPGWLLQSNRPTGSYEESWGANKNDKACLTNKVPITVLALVSFEKEKHDLFSLMLTFYWNTEVRIKVKEGKKVDNNTISRKKFIDNAVNLYSTSTPCKLTDGQRTFIETSCGKKMIFLVYFCHFLTNICEKKWYTAWPTLYVWSMFERKVWLRNEENWATDVQANLTRIHH